MDNAATLAAARTTLAVMELAIDPTHLSAASVALIGCATTLDDAATAFVLQASAELTEVGMAAAEAARRGIIAADRAVHIITTDIERLAMALGHLSHLYPTVDTTAVPPR